VWLDVLKKIAKYLEMSCQNSYWNKKSTSKLNLKVQNIYIAPLLKPKKLHNKSCFETDYGENIKISFCQKLPKMSFLELLHLLKNHDKLSKIAKLAKKTPNLLTLKLDYKSWPEVLLEVRTVPQLPGTHDPPRFRVSSSVSGDVSTRLPGLRRRLRYRLQIKTLT